MPLPAPLLPPPHPPALHRHRPTRCATSSGLPKDIANLEETHAKELEALEAKLRAEFKEQLAKRGAEEAAALWEILGDAQRLKAEKQALKREKVGVRV
jgi:hypothetical protein